MRITERLAMLGNKYFKESFEKKTIRTQKYDKDFLYLGKEKRNKSPVGIECRDAKRVIMLGIPGCLIGDTLVKTDIGKVRMENLDSSKHLIKCYDIEKDDFVYSSFNKSNMLIKKQWSIDTESGWLHCSEDHIWLLMEDGKIVERTTKELSSGDYLVTDDECDCLSKVRHIIKSEDNENMYDIHVPTYNNFVLGNDIVTHNSGKTFAIRSFIDRAKEAGAAVVFLTDVKRELISSLLPVQEKFQGMLLPHEKPKSMKVVSLRPTFFKQLLPYDWDDERKDREGLKRHDFWYSPNLHKMTKGDFFTFIKVNTMKPLQQSVVELWYDEISKYMSQNNDFDLEIMMSLLDKIDDINPVTIQSIKLKLRPILQSHFYEPEHSVDVVDLLNSGFVPSLNLEDFDKFSRDSGFAYPETAITLLLREIISAKRANKIGKLWIVIDECARFFGENNKNSLLNFLLESIEVDRRYDVNYFFATQTIETMPSRMIKNSNYICLPAKIDREDVKKAISGYGMFRCQQTINNDANNIINRMNPVTRDWTLLNRDDKTQKVFNVLAPMSWHMESTDGNKFG